jgi:hypothetical protein
MPATVTTRETFPRRAKKARLDAEVDLRIRAGAVRCSYRMSGGKWLMTTEWNVLGEND